jgi:predicted nuclease of restriction endonuclease-like (RecB) superfamily
MVNMKFKILNNKKYNNWLKSIKFKIRNAQIKAAVKVNTELLSLYWNLGADIVEKQINSKWGEGLIKQLSKDLSREFSDMRGFSRTNLLYIKQWYLFYSQSNVIVQQAVGQLKSNKKSQQLVGQIGKKTFSQITQIPWGHNIVIISKCKDVKEALYYVQNTITYNWSRSVLEHQIEKGLYKREGKSINNFAITLPKLQSDLAHQTLKDPYVFDFLNITKKSDERELEKALISNATQFLLELGAGFSYVGKQFPVKV